MHFHQCTSLLCHRTHRIGQSPCLNSASDHNPRPRYTMELNFIKCGAGLLPLLVQYGCEKRLLGLSALSLSDVPSLQVKNTINSHRLDKNIIKSTVICFGCNYHQAVSAPGRKFFRNAFSHQICCLCPFCNKVMPSEDVIIGD